METVECTPPDSGAQATKKHTILLPQIRSYMIYDIPIMVFIAIVFRLCCLPRYRYPV